MVKMNILTNDSVIQFMTPLAANIELQAEKRAKILEIAKKRLMQYGVSKTTMAEIAEDAQMAVGTIYLYFKNKDEIVLAIAQDCRLEQDQLLQSIVGDTLLTPRKKLETFFLQKFRYATNFRTETPHGKELIAYLIQNFPESLPAWEARFEKAIATIFQQGIDQGAFQIQDVEEAAHLLRLATSGFFPLPYLELPKYLQEEELIKILRWFLQSMETAS